MVKIPMTSPVLEEGPAQKMVRTDRTAEEKQAIVGQFVSCGDCLVANIDDSQPFGM